MLPRISWLKLPTFELLNFSCSSNIIILFCFFQKNISDKLEFYNSLISLIKSFNVHFIEIYQLSFYYLYIRFSQGLYPFIKLKSSSSLKPSNSFSFITCKYESSVFLNFLCLYNFDFWKSYFFLCKTNIFSIFFYHTANIHFILSPKVLFKSFCK